MHNDSKKRERHNVIVPLVYWDSRDKENPTVAIDILNPNTRAALEAAGCTLPPEDKERSMMKIQGEGMTAKEKANILAQIERDLAPDYATSNTRTLCWLSRIVQSLPTDDPPPTPELFHVPVVEQPNKASWKIDGRILQYQRTGQFGITDTGHGAVVSFSDMQAIAHTCVYMNAVMAYTKDRLDGKSGEAEYVGHMKELLREFNAGPVTP